MPEIAPIGKILIIAGAAMLAIGIFITFGSKYLPIGKLPGDILVKRGNFTFYFPIATSILLSILLTILLRIFKR